MSLKINESTQEKAKSLSDLFGDNLTEAGRADLEWAAKCAAQDLAKVIFSEQLETTETEANFGSAHMLGLENVALGVSWSSHLPSSYEALVTGSASDLQMNELPVNFRVNLKNVPHYRDYAVSSEQMKDFFDSIVRNMHELACRESFLTAHDYPKRFCHVSGLKLSECKIQGPNGEEYFTTEPVKLKEDNMRLLPQTIRRLKRQLTHKVK
ncbi:TPA: hypothetical protein ACPUS8_005436 [Klebsiella pneumoniae]|nr:hypothetical protein [Klebsiella pneumoniae]